MQPPEDTGFGPHVGVRVVARGDGSARALLDAGPEHLNPHGVVHGGALATLVDHTMGAAVYTVLTPGESCATVSVSLTFIAPARPGPVECEAVVVRRTRQLVALQAAVRQEGKAVAEALGSYVVLPRS